MGQDSIIYKINAHGEPLVLPIGYLDAYLKKFPGDCVTIVKTFDLQAVDAIEGTTHPTIPSHVAVGGLDDGQILYREKGAYYAILKAEDTNLSGGDLGSLSQDLEDLYVKAEATDIIEDHPEYLVDSHFKTALRYTVRATGRNLVTEPGFTNPGYEEGSCFMVVMEAQDAIAMESQCRYQGAWRDLVMHMGDDTLLTIDW